MDGMIVLEDHKLGTEKHYRAFADELQAQQLIAGQGVFNATEWNGIPAGEAMLARTNAARLDDGRWQVDRWVQRYSRPMDTLLVAGHDGRWHEFPLWTTVEFNDIDFGELIQPKP